MVEVRKKNPKLYLINILRARTKNVLFMVAFQCFSPVPTEKKSFNNCLPNQG
jgi:hypothetical protein